MDAREKGMTQKSAVEGEPPPYPLEEDSGAGPWQGTGAFGVGEPAHPDVPGCWTTVMRRQAGRSNPH